MVFELYVRIEVVLDGPFPAARDDQDVSNSAGRRLLDDILNGGLVHDGNHFLRLGLRVGKEPGAESGRGNDRLHSTSTNRGPGNKPIFAKSQIRKRPSDRFSRQGR